MRQYDKQIIADEIVEKINQGEKADVLALEYGFAHKERIDAIFRFVRYTSFAKKRCRVGVWPRGALHH